jgi:hypothetical protein
VHYRAGSLQFERPLLRGSKQASPVKTADAPE